MIEGFMLSNLEEISFKLSLINSLDNNQISKQLKIHIYLYKINIFIKKAHKLIKKLKVKKNQYHPSFDKLAFKLLSTSPFVTKVHLCKLFKCNVAVLDAWIRENESLGEAIDRGFSEGEVIARGLLLEAAVEPASLSNTQLLLLLSNNVYNIKDEYTLNIADSPLNRLVDSLSKLRNGGNDEKDSTI